MADRASVVEKIREIAERVGSSVGIEIVDVQLLGGGGSRVLRLFIDRVPGQTLTLPPREFFVPAGANPELTHGAGLTESDAQAVEDADEISETANEPDESTAVSADGSDVAAGGVTLADCEFMSHQLSAILDVEDIIPGGNYTLEVSSPGVERKLSKPAEFERFLGHKVKVVLRQPVDNQRQWVGALRNYAEGTITLEPAPGKSVRIPLEQVEKANLKFEW
jgi:ribosome maturation factor RimP